MDPYLTPLEDFQDPRPFSVDLKLSFEEQNAKVVRETSRLNRSERQAEGHAARTRTGDQGDFKAKIVKMQAGGEL